MLTGRVERSAKLERATANCGSYNMYKRFDWTDPTLVDDPTLYSVFVIIVMILQKNLK